MVALTIRYVSDAVVGVVMVEEAIFSLSER